MKVDNTVSKGDMKGLFSLASVLLIGSISDTSALIFYSSADVEKNTTAPTGPNADTGWDLQGTWGNFTGTPIGPHHFLAAHHIGGSVGDPFVFRGVAYTTIATTKDPSSDLRVWEVSGTFPAFASLYDGPAETGHDLFVFGRGAHRGAEVRVNLDLKGWQWGAWDKRLRWGQNQVADLTEDPGQPSGNLPHFLKVAFDPAGGPNEAHLAVGDSSGAVFIEHSGVWKLAGINFGVEGPYGLTANGPRFAAAVFDEGGLYRDGGPAGSQLVLDTPLPQPGHFYSTRIKARLAWIQEAISVVTAAPVLLEASDVGGTFTVVSGASIDTANKTIRIPAQAAARFYGLRAATALSFTSTTLDGSTLVLTYE